MTTTSLVNAMRDLYTMAHDGRFIGFVLEDLADYVGLSVDECDELIDAAEDEGVLYCDADVYDAAKLAAYEREEAEYEAEMEREAVAYMFAARGWYAPAC